MCNVTLIAGASLGPPASRTRWPLDRDYLKWRHNLAVSDANVYDLSCRAPAETQSRSQRSTRSRPLVAVDKMLLDYAM